MARIRMLRIPMHSIKSRRLAIISKDKDCIEKISAVAQSHPVVKEVEKIEAFDSLQCDGIPLGCSNSKSLPDLFFIDLSADRERIKAFLESLQCEFPKSSHHSIVLIDTPDHIDSIMAFSLRPCVRLVLNKPFLTTEIAHAIDQSFPRRAVPK